MNRFTLAAVIFASAFASGCTGEVGYTTGVAGGGYGPDLVYAAPGVQVIADYDEPIFFVDGFYWRNDGSSWYRSSYYTGGWAYAPPPQAVLRIERPREYVHYRQQGYRARAQPTPVVRDHRDNRRFEPAPAPRRREAPPPAQGRGRKDEHDHRK